MKKSKDGQSLEEKYERIVRRELPEFKEDELYQRKTSSDQYNGKEVPESSNSLKFHHGNI